MGHEAHHLMVLGDSGTLGIVFGVVIPEACLDLRMITPFEAHTACQIVMELSQSSTSSVSRASWRQDGVEKVSPSPICDAGTKSRGGTRCRWRLAHRRFGELCRGSFLSARQIHSYISHIKCTDGQHWGEKKQPYLRKGVGKGHHNLPNLQQRHALTQISWSKLQSAIFRSRLVTAIAGFLCRSVLTSTPRHHQCDLLRTWADAATRKASYLVPPSNSNRAAFPATVPGTASGRLEPSSSAWSATQQHWSVKRREAVPVSSNVHREERRCKRT